LPTGLAAAPAAQTYADVLRTAVMRPARRDAVDARIVATMISRGARVIDSQTDVGGYLSRAPTVRSVTVPVTAEARRVWLDDRAAQLAIASDLDVPALWPLVGASGSGPQIALLLAEAPDFGPPLARLSRTG
jgi:hypothetical protein